MKREEKRAEILRQIREEYDPVAKEELTAALKELLDKLK